MDVNSRRLFRRDQNAATALDPLLVTEFLPRAVVLPPKMSPTVTSPHELVGLLSIGPMCYPRGMAKYSIYEGAGPDACA